MKSLRCSQQSGRAPLLFGAAFGALSLFTAGPAAASSGIDSPESGVVQAGRGGAWLARADDPLAVYYNPAAMSFQASGVHLGVHLMFPTRCFTRQGPGGSAVSPGGGLPGPGAEPSNAKEVPPDAAVCAEYKFFPNPQIAGVYRINDRMAVGLGIVAPHAAGHAIWPESVPYTNKFGLSQDKDGNPITQPAPNRYMLTESDAKIFFPTLSFSYAPTENLSFGAGLVMGVALVSFTNFAETLSSPRADSATSDNLSSDIRAKLTAKDLFVPGFVLSGLWSATPNLDVAGWFKWMDAVKTDQGSIHFDSNVWEKNGSKSDAPLGTDANNVATLTFRLPMEAKLGVRYHQARVGVTGPAWSTKPGRKVRDPMSQDLFDVELDFTWSNNSTVDNLNLSFPKANDFGLSTVKVNLGSGTFANVPINADVAHHWKDVVGIRLGGDFVAIPNRLSLRAGGFFETKGQDDAYLNIDFHNSEKGGLSLGGTVRLGPIDVSAAYQHTFYGTLDNKGVGAVTALSGDGAGCPKGQQNPTAGPGCFRSQQAINGGQLRSTLDELGIAGTMRF
ncbi:MAG: hypothetical protein ABI193_01535 [Minicystis sp.]